VKAVVLEKQGPPHVLSYRDVENPRIGDDDVLVRIMAAGVNRLDIWVRSGVYTTELPRILGSEGAGVVEAVGSRVSNISPGDMVLINPALTDGVCSFCLQGYDSLCENLRLMGAGSDGCYAELVRVPARNVHQIPKGLGFEEAASVIVNYMTVWHGLVTRAGLEYGSTVLVVAAGSGVGVAAIQLSKLYGCTVITTVGEEWKREKAQQLGADYVVNRRVEDPVEAVKGFTGGKGVDVVFEHAGGAMWEAGVKCLKPGGAMVFCGATSGETVGLNIRYAYRRQLRLIGSYSWNRGEIEKVLRLVEMGRLRPIVDRVFKLEDAAKAHIRMERDEHFGKILLKP
jgi:NADPH:quinone reductase-like Zn-dependent oxidoreductase